MRVTFAPTLRFSHSPRPAAIAIPEADLKRLGSIAATLAKSRQGATYDFRGQKHIKVTGDTCTVYADATTYEFSLGGDTPKLKRILFMGTSPRDTGLQGSDITRLRKVLTELDPREGESL